jgi:hypothetical protein
MPIYRAHRFAPPSRTSGRQVDPRLDTVALLLIVLDLCLLAVFAWKVARVEAAGVSPNHLILYMTLLSTIPSLVGLSIAWYMRGRMYWFSLPLLFASVMTFPGIHYACATTAAKHFLPYAQMEYATRRSYTVGKKPVTLHVYPGSRDAVASLVRILQDPNSIDRNAAVMDVGIIGPPAAEAVPYLSQIMRERDRDASYRASQSLVKIGGAGIDALIQALSADEDRVRLVAILALQHAGPAGRPAIPELEKRWSKEDPAIRSQIDIAISNLRRQSRG